MLNLASLVIVLTLLGVLAESQKQQSQETAQAADGPQKTGDGISPKSLGMFRNEDEAGDEEGVEDDNDDDWDEDWETGEEDEDEKKKKESQTKTETETAGGLARLSPHLEIPGCGSGEKNIDLSASSKKNQDDCFWFGTQQTMAKGKLSPVTPTDGAAPPMHIPQMQRFKLDSHTVTNRQFQSFVEATSYKTEAELYTWSFVLEQQANKKTIKAVDGPKGYGRVKSAMHWMAVKGAHWRTPYGSLDKSVRQLGLLEHPAVHVSYKDAEEYCHWATGTTDNDDLALGDSKSDSKNSKSKDKKKRDILRLPTEWEWEYAARGGLVNSTFPWGDEAPSWGETGKRANTMNIWHERDWDESSSSSSSSRGNKGNKFGKSNDWEKDGYNFTAPAKSYAPNGLGIFQTCGNVWEWVLGGTHEKRTLRGGSFVDSLEGQYNHATSVSTKQHNSGDSGASNIGFRCASGGRLNRAREERFERLEAQRLADKGKDTRTIPIENGQVKHQGTQKNQPQKKRSASDSDSSSGQSGQSGQSQKERVQKQPAKQPKQPKPPKAKGEL